MEEHRRTWFSPRGVVIAGEPPRELPLYAGALHYWRLEPADWGAALAAMKAIGLEVVSTYVPWSVHERGPGRFDWSGARDLGRFLDEVAAAGMHAIVRPGPHINAELTLFGFPERVLAAPECQALTAAGTPAWLPAPARMFPVPSYASKRFIAETEGWLEAVGEALEGYLAPDGPVVAVQLDNEMAHFFRTGAYDLDYHPDALAWWAEHSGGAEPPRRWIPEDPGRCARWVEHKEVYGARALAWIAAALERVGLGGLARFHNAPPVAPSSLGAVRAGEAAASMPAWDVYQTLRGYRALRQAGLYVAANATLPFVAELGVGGPAYLPPPAPEAQASAAIALVGCGVRAMSFYMAVGRDRWSGPAIDRRGQPRGAADWIARLIAALRRIDLPNTRVAAPVALLASRADTRHAVASSAIDPATPLLGELVDLGPGGFAELARDPGAREAARWHRAVSDALDLYEIPWSLLDERAPVEELAARRLVVCPSTGRIDGDLWQRLRQVAGSGTRVVLGPEVPSADAFDEPLSETGLVSGMGLLRAESLGDLDALGADLAAAAAPLDDLWIAPEAPEVRCAPLATPDGEVRALVLANPGAAITAAVAVPGGVRFVDALSGEALEASGERLEVPLGERRARLLVRD